MSPDPSNFTNENPIAPTQEDIDQLMHDAEDYPELINGEYKDTLNQLAVDYAIERDKIKDAMRQKGIMDEKQLKCFIPWTPSCLKAAKHACKMFKRRSDGHWTYLGKDLGEKGMNFPKTFLGLLNRYQFKYTPDQKPTPLFTTYMKQRLYGLYQDYWRSVKREKKQLEKIMAEQKAEEAARIQRESDALPIPEFSSDPHFLIRRFGQFSDVLTEHGWILHKIRGYRGKRERFCVFYTRDLVIMFVPDCYGDISIIKDKVDPILSQPYAVYIRSKNVLHQQHALQTLIFWKENNPHFRNINLEDLYSYFCLNQLIEERYKPKASLNDYFCKTNLSVSLKEYRELSRQFISTNLEDEE